MDVDILNQIDKSAELIQQGNAVYLKVWKEHIVFSFKWWVAVLLAVLPWISWFKFRKKESTDRLLYSGFIVLIISSFLDFIGSTYDLWRYTVDVEPIIPSFIPWDFCLLPVEVMFLIQYKPQVSPFIKAFIYAFTNAFIGEPILEWLSFYDPIQWKNLYSFPIYFCIYLVAYHLSKRQHFELV